MKTIIASGRINLKRGVAALWLSLLVFFLFFGAAGPAWAADGDVTINVYSMGARYIELTPINTLNSNQTKIILSGVMSNKRVTLSPGTYKYEGWQKNDKALYYGSGTINVSADEPNKRYNFVVLQFFVSLDTAVTEKGHHLNLTEDKLEYEFLSKETVDFQWADPNPEITNIGSESRQYSALLVNYNKTGDEAIVLQYKYILADKLLSTEYNIVAVTGFNTVTSGQIGHSLALAPRLSYKVSFKVPQEYVDGFKVYCKKNDTHYVAFEEYEPVEINGNILTYELEPNLRYHYTLHNLNYTLEPSAQSEVGNIKLSRTFDFLVAPDGVDIEDTAAQIFVGSTVEVLGYSNNPEDYVLGNILQKSQLSEFKLNNAMRVNNDYKESNLYLNIAGSRALDMTPGDTQKLEAFRTWQAINSHAGNYFVEPDFHYEVVGDKTVSLTAGGAEGRRYVNIEAQSSGVNVIKITYDAMHYMAGSYRHFEPLLYYNAIDPVNTGIVVVNVGGHNNAGINPGLLIKRNDEETPSVLTEYDTIYYDKDREEFASYTFTPSPGSSTFTKVEVHKPIHEGSGVTWGNGWADCTPNADGSYTARLYDGRNIFHFATADGSEVYYVVNCRAAEVVIENLSRPEATDYQVGDKLQIIIKNLSLPIQKMSGIYNPNFPYEGWIEYTQSATGRIYRSAGSQYAAVYNPRFTVDLIHSGKLILNGQIHNAALGSPLGTHTQIPDFGFLPNLNAKPLSTSLYYSILPTITLEVKRDAAQDLAQLTFGQLAGLLVNGQTVLSGIAEDWGALDLVRNMALFDTSKAGLSLTATSQEKDVKITARLKADNAESWQEVGEISSGQLQELLKAEAYGSVPYMVEVTVAPIKAEDGFAQTYSVHCVPLRNLENAASKAALPTLSSLRFTGLTSSEQTDGMLKATAADLGYGFLSSRNDFTVNLPSDISALNLDLTATEEQYLALPEGTTGGDLPDEEHLVEFLVTKTVAPSVTVNGAAVDENGKVTVDLTKAEAIEQTVAAAKMTAKTEKAPAEAETSAYQFSGEDENGVMKYWNIDAEGNAVYVTMPDTTTKVVTEEQPAETSPRILNTDANGDGRVDTIYVTVTSNLEGKAAAAQTNTYTIHINYIQTVKVTVAGKLAEGNFILYRGDEVVTPNADGTYCLRYGENYTYTYTAKGYQGLNKQTIELPNQAAWTLELPALSPVNQQTGEATVRIVGADSLLRATTKVQVDPFLAADLFSLGYVTENYNGYTVLHALVEAGTASGNSTIFTCENGIFRPKDTATSAGSWVCEVNHVVVPQAALQSTMLNAGDKVDFYWQPYEGGNHIWFADASGNALEETSITQGESATLKLQGHSGVDMNNLVVYVGSKLVTPTVSSANGNEITISAADLNSPQSYFVSATAGQSSLAIAQVTVNGKTTQNPGVSGKSVTFRLIGCSLTEDGQKIDFGEALLDYKGAEYQTWIPTTTFTFGLDETVTVGDVFKKALDGRGLGYVGFEKNYIESITAPSVLGGYELAEMTNGARSGWMYTVNGKHPNKGLNEWEVKNGDVIIWHYVNDYQYEVQDWSQNSGADPNYRPLGSSKTWNKWLEAKDIDPNPSMNKGAAGVSGEKTSIIAPEANIDKNGVANATVTYKDVADAVTKAKKDEAKSITIMLQNTGKAKSVAVNLQVDSAKEIAKAELGLNVNTTQGSLAIPDKALEAIAGQAGGVDIRINVESKDTKAEAVKAAVESALTQAAASLRGTAENLFANACVTEVTITSNNKEITSFGGHELTINLPVNSKNFEKDNNYKVVVISGDDTVESIIGKCLRVNGDLVVQVKVSHLSTFIVTTEKEKAETAKITMSFADINENQWFYEAVKFVYEAGLMNGDGENTFNPNGNLNRAMLVTILYRLEQTPEVTEAAKFSDVAAGQWYTKAVIWASSNGIVNGYEDGTFKPNNNVSREEMAAMLMRYAEFKKIDVSATKDISSYKDATNVAEWAKQNMSWANSVGLIQGDENNNLNPQGKATRAEAAMILMRLVKNVIR